MSKIRISSARLQLISLFLVHNTLLAMQVYLWAFFPPYVIEPMTLVQWTTHSINVLYKVAKQVNKNNKQVGWQQKEESYTQACVHSLVEDFHGALLLKIDECPIWGQKKVFQLSKTRKTAFPSLHGQSANWEKSIKIWQNLLHTQGVIKRKAEQTRIANVYLPLMSNDICIEFSICKIECILFEEKEYWISTSSVNSLMSFICWWLRDSCLPIPDKAELCYVLPIDIKSIDLKRD